jgi:hypothetical protein
VESSSLCDCLKSLYSAHGGQGERMHIPRSNPPEDGDGDGADQVGEMRCEMVMMMVKRLRAR